MPGGLERNLDSSIGSFLEALNRTEGDLILVISKAKRLRLRRLRGPKILGKVLSGSVALAELAVEW